MNLPIIHYSVLWWRTLHQGESIGLTGSTIDNSILWPLPLTMVGFTCLFGAAVADAHARGACRSEGRGADAPDGDGMNPWPFVIAAYAVAIALTAALLLWAFASMRRAEAAADALKRK